MGTKPKCVCLNDDNQVKKWGVGRGAETAHRHLPHKHEEEKQRADPNAHIKSGRGRDHPQSQGVGMGFPQGKLNSYIH